MTRMSAKKGWGGGREVGRKEVTGILGSGKRLSNHRVAEQVQGETNARPKGAEEAGDVGRSQVPDVRHANL